MATPLPPLVRQALQQGVALPALPLALTAARRLDERRQRALIRYYLAAGAGGVAVGVHTTQFAIRAPQHALLRPVLELAAEEIKRHETPQRHALLAVAGICGSTGQAVKEAELARDLGYHAGLVSLAAFPDAGEAALLAHCRTVAEVLPLFGFYLQPAVGGRSLSYRFWRQLAEVPELVAIKIAPFNRYQTLDVVRAVAASGRADVALYTGNDDHIVLDLLTPYRCRQGEGMVERRIVGGLLGQWAVWTRKAALLLEECHRLTRTGDAVPVGLLRLAGEITDANAALFDAAHDFKGCIPGLHEVLRRQGLLEGIWCLDPAETLSPGQAAEIDRVARDYPHLTDDDFVTVHRDEWLR